MRCSCKRRKDKLPCAEVQRLLQAATGSAAYDARTSLRLLPCDAACTKAAAAAAAAGAAEPAGKGRGGSPQAATQPAKAGSAAGSAAEQQEQQPRRKLSKEEKQRLAEEKQRAKEAAARRQKILQVRSCGQLLAGLKLESGCSATHSCAPVPYCCSGAQSGCLKPLTNVTTPRPVPCSPLRLRLWCWWLWCWHWACGTCCTWPTRLRRPSGATRSSRSCDSSSHAAPRSGDSSSHEATMRWTSRQVLFL